MGLSLKLPIELRVLMKFIWRDGSINQIGCRIVKAKEVCVAY